ncbi:MAG: 1-deoxy-D-xylulose-5-phosphate synthase [Thermotogae bacterium]|nr:1-deoxy-D-xylulose-5-phosphate synthase [Thermotogota bacterium]
MLYNLMSYRDLRELSYDDLEKLAEEIRQLIVEITSQNGGHVGPNLGVVELTIALLRNFDPPRDKIIWDVSHQTYPYKILTDRRDVFHTLRQYGGISGFSNIYESEYDPWGAGHAGTALSAALGLAKARDYTAEDYHVVAVIGDASLTIGMTLEAMNNAGSLGVDLITILNDNGWSIDKNVGRIAQMLAHVQVNPLYNTLRDKIWRLLPSKGKYWSSKLEDVIKTIVQDPAALFEFFGFRYIGPIDGHNIRRLDEILSKAKKLKGPVLIHVITEKGHGYKPALNDPETFHGLGSYDKIDGRPKRKPNSLPKYSKLFGKALLEIAQQDIRVVGITAAMPKGTGLDLLRDTLPSQYYDVGIAEQHAVTFAGGLARGGVKPFVAIYSTFLQRAYDSVIHDVALQKLPVRFFLDRAGLVGDDGPTHHGVFDLSYLRPIPNVVIMAPKDGDELRDMVYTAWRYEEGPIFVRFPRGEVPVVPEWKEVRMIPIGQWELLEEGDEDIVFLPTGYFVYPVLNLAIKLREMGIYPTIYNARFIKPLDERVMEEVVSKARYVFTFEDNALAGGFGSGVLEYLSERGWLNSKEVMRFGIPDRFITHGKKELLLKEIGLDIESLLDRIIQALGVKKKR